MDPIQSIKYNKDTTLSLLLAAQRQGFKLFYMEQRHLFLQDGDPRAGAAVGALRVLARARHRRAALRPRARGDDAHGRGRGGAARQLAPDQHVRGHRDRPGGAGLEGRWKAERA